MGQRRIKDSSITVRDIISLHQTERNQLTLMGFRLEDTITVKQLMGVLGIPVTLRILLTHPQFDYLKMKFNEGMPINPTQRDLFDYALEFITKLS